MCIVQTYSFLKVYRVAIYDKMVETGNLKAFVILYLPKNIYDCGDTRKKY